MRRRAAGKRDRFPVSDQDPGATGRADWVPDSCGSVSALQCARARPHRRQTSDAIGSAASQLGPRAVAPATQLNKGYRPASRQDCGRAGGSVRAAGQSRWALLGVGTGGPQGRTDLCGAGGTSPRHSQCDPDETGWKAGGHLWWMWAFSSSQVTVYSIQPGSGFERAATVLGAGFEGFLVRYGWIVYREFSQAMHQTCLAHLLRRCREMILVAGAGGREFPRSVQEILQRALQLRDRRDRGQVGELGVAVARGRLEARLDRTLQRRFRSPQNRRLANHLLREREALFTF
jgi:transposase